MMEKRVLLHFEGRVQGVGFRYTARYLAQNHDIKGWVMNLPDGRVRLLAQGKESAIENFLEDLKKEFAGYIKNITVEEQPVDFDLDGFRIRFY